MGNSKIIYYGETLIDLTGDTVEAAKLLKGVTAHDKKGEKITGTFKAADPYAFIIVNYPEGSTVSCTNSFGDKNLSTTQKLFYIKKNATSCVVTATLGSQSTSATVTGIAEGSSKTIMLSYELVLFENGVLSSALGALKNQSLSTYAIENGKITCAETGSNTGNRTGYGSFTLPVDLTGRTNLCIKASSYNYPAYIKFGVSAVGTGAFAASQSKTKTESETLTIPVSSFDGSYDILIEVTGLGDYSFGALTTTAYIEKVWLV
nr:MAG TPA: tail protein [Caudoviricetes sp.]